MYKSLNISKQAVHKMLNRTMKIGEEEAYLRVLIEQIRKDHPTMNSVAMYYKINPVSIGRDRFLRICKEYGFTTKRKTSGRRTTDSTGVIRFPNLLEGLKLNRINQAFSSDITYYEISGCYYYITFVMDCYSRRILGWNVSSRLLTEHTTLPALKQAIKTRKGSIREGVIFHSDGGGQYYDKNFLKLTSKHGFANSMCEYAYENGKAERLNGVIKNNYLKYARINTLEDLIREVDLAVKKYNHEKPHKALKYLTPVEFENKHVNLQLPKTPKMTKSFEANHQALWGIEPQNPEPKTPLNRNVIKAYHQES
jgi:hypothetical protein